MFNKKKAFTLIELLVAIALIGLLATISVIALNNARAKGRDAKRVADVKQVQTALELFFNDKGRYPTPAEFQIGSLFSTSTLGTTTYMAIIPTAPNPPDGNCVSNQNIYNYSQIDNGDSYKISFCLGGGINQITSGNNCVGPAGYMNQSECFSPTDLANLKLWLRADAGIVESSGKVSQWNDQSGNGNNAAQGDINYQPQWVATSSLNGKPVIRFDGSDDWLQGNTIPDINTSSFTIFVIASGDAVSTSDLYDQLFNINWYSDGFALSRHRYASLQALNIINNNEINTNIALSNSGFPYKLFTVKKIINSSWSIYDNSVFAQDGGSLATNSFANTNYGIGYYYACASYCGYATHYDGDIVEIILYDSALSDDDRQKVENYLKTKYGL